MDKSEELTIRIIAEESGKKLECVSMEATLLGDLGLDGDDAWSVIERLHNENGVNFSEFNFSEHFRSEPCFKSPIYFFKRVSGLDHHAAAGKIPITVSQMAKASINGYWRNHV